MNYLVLKRRRFILLSFWAIVKVWVLFDKLNSFLWNFSDYEQIIFESRLEKDIILEEEDDDESDDFIFFPKK